MLETFVDLAFNDGKIYRLSSVQALIAVAMLFVGACLVPKISMIRTVVDSVTPKVPQAAIGAFYNAHFGWVSEPLTIDSKTVRGSVN